MSIIKTNTAPPAASGLVIPAGVAPSGLLGSTSGLLGSTPSAPLGHQTPELAGSDFVILDEPRKQANVLIFGDNGNGKTSFITRYAPHPVAFINFDKRARHAVQEAGNMGRRIFHVEIDAPANLSALSIEQAMKAGQASVSKFMKNFEWAVAQSQKGLVRSIGIDTGTELTELLNLAVKGRPGGKDKDYGQSKDWVNRQWWQIFRMAREGNAHLIILARAKEVWQNSEPTGVFTFRGPEVMADGVDWAGQIRLQRGVGGAGVVGGIRKVGVGGGGAGAGSGGVKGFELLITKAGVNIEELGEVYTSEQWEEYGGPFVYACGLQYKGSSTEDWE